MALDQQIKESREKISRLEAELNREKDRLRALERSCPHANTKIGAVKFKLPDGDITHPCLICLDCGVGMPAKNRRIVH